MSLSLNSLKGVTCNPVFIDDGQVARDAEILKQGLSFLPEPVARPVLVVVSGLPGVGKSHFCRQLAQKLPLAVLESDALRKFLFSQPCYSPQESARLFEACHLLIQDLLRRGISLALDATNLSERHRQHLYRISDHEGAKLILIRVEAPPQVVRQRLEARHKGVDSEDRSDADWQVYQKMKTNAEKIQRNHFAVDTSRDITPVIRKIVREATR